MTPTQQALALDALQSIVEQHDGYCEHHIGASTLSFALANTASDALAAISSLEAAPAAPEFADKTITAREVARQVFALCEWFEDLQDGVQDSQEEARFKSGQRFSAKRIRNGIGTWLTDEENARKQLACAAPAAVAEPAEPDGTLHDDGCFTWKPGKCPAERRDHRAGWRADFYLAPVAVPPPTEPSAEPMTLTKAANDVLAERRRQTEAEGFDTAHDDEHSTGELADAAACYALGVYSERGDAGVPGDIPPYWPWDESWWRPKDRRRNLVRAAALLLAEIERLDRAAGRASRWAAAEPWIA